jgi:hypothetical protein
VKVFRHSYPRGSVGTRAFDREPDLAPTLGVGALVVRRSASSNRKHPRRAFVPTQSVGTRDLADLAPHARRGSASGRRSASSNRKRTHAGQPFPRRAWEREISPISLPRSAWERKCGDRSASSKRKRTQQGTLFPRRAWEREISPISLPRSAWERAIIGLVKLLLYSKPFVR